MTIDILICDDSEMARKQLARALPRKLPADISFASNGQEGLRAIAQGHGDVVFMDLNMPVMDGYEALEILNKKSIKKDIVIVSSDIQPEAHRRVFSLGARAFIKKPVSEQEILSVISQLLPDILDCPQASNHENAHGRANLLSPQLVLPQLSVNEHFYDCLQEVANIAIGQAADLVAKAMGVFVLLPLPNVNIIDYSELQMALSAANRSNVFAVCQGFIGSGIAGEALLLFNNSNFSDISTLMKYKGTIAKTTELELLMDLTSILIGACLKGLTQQLDVQLSQGHPVVIGQDVFVENLLTNNLTRWKKSLAIEINYRIEDHNIDCDLLILFTEESLKIINQKIYYL